MANQTSEKVKCRYVNGHTAFPYAYGKMILCSLNPCPYGDNLGEEIDHEGCSYEGEPETRVCKIEGMIDKKLVIEGIVDKEVNKGLVEKLD